MASEHEKIAGRLFCTVLSAKNLAPKSFEGLSSSFCLLSVNKSVSVEKSKVVPNTLSPEWEQLFSFSITQPFQTLEVSVHHDCGGESAAMDGFQGRVFFSLETLSDQQPHTLTRELQARELKDEVSGEIALRLQYKYTPEWSVLYQSMELVRKRKWEEALPLLNQSLSMLPDELRLLEARSETYVQLNKLDEGLKDALRMIEINPNVESAHYQLGMVYEAQGKKDYARESYLQAKAYNNKDNRIIDALTRLNTTSVGALEGGNVAELVYIASQEFSNQQYANAAKQLSTLIRQEQGNFSFFLARAICFLGMGRAEQAQEDAMKVVALHPKWPKEGPIKTGYLQKDGHLNRMKKRRWFILKLHFLYYYNTPEDSVPNGVIPLHESCTIIRTLKGGKKISINIKGGRTFQITAADKKQADSWLVEFHKVNKAALEMPAIDGSMSSMSVNDKRRSRRTNLLGKFKGRKVDTKVDDLENVVKEGYLHKTGQVRRTAWKKRYFILKPLFLYYFEDKPSGTKNLNSLGAIPLENCKWSIGQKDVYEHHVFELQTPDRIYILYAGTHQEMMDWKEAIEACYHSTPRFRTNSSVSEDEQRPRVNTLSESETESEVENEQDMEKLEAVLEEEHSQPEKAEVVPSPVPTLEPTISIEAIEHRLGDRHERISGNRMSVSEQKYFRKFGLEPPKEQQAHTSLTRLSTASLLSYENLIASNSSQSMTNSNSSVEVTPPTSPARNSGNYAKPTSGQMMGQNAQNYTASGRSPSRPASSSSGRPPATTTSYGSIQSAEPGAPGGGVGSHRMSANTPLQPQRRRPPPPKDDGCCTIL